MAGPNFFAGMSDAVGVVYMLAAFIFIWIPDSKHMHKLVRMIGTRKSASPN